MRVDIIQNKGKKGLQRIVHDGEIYVMAPKKGSYKIHLHNTCSKRRLAVVTVDGVNVVTGEDGDFEGPGYVLPPWGKLEIPGWRRDDGKVAAFLFRPEKQSYANQTGRGTKNVGVVGVAVFDEEEKPVVIVKTPEEHHHHHHYDWPWGYTWPLTYRWSLTTDAPVRTSTTFSNSIEYSSSRGVNTTYCSTSGGGGDQTLSFGPTQASRAAERVKRAQDLAESMDSIDVGTGYGHEVSFETTSTTFNRATEHPAEVICLRYATRARLESWGIPVEEMRRPTSRPEAFPGVSSQGVPPPPGWRG